MSRVQPRSYAEKVTARPALLRYQTTSQNPNSIQNSVFGPRLAWFGYENEIFINIIMTET